MNQDTYGTYRVTVLELERATRLAERRRVIAERMVAVPKDGVWRRMLRRRTPRRAVITPADCPAGSRCALADA